MFLFNRISFICLYDYQAAMDKTAYNFYNSRKIEKFAETPVYSEITGMTHLYTNKPLLQFKISSMFSL